MDPIPKEHEDHYVTHLLETLGRSARLSEPFNEAALSLALHVPNEQLVASLKDGLASNNSDTKAFAQQSLADLLYFFLKNEMKLPNSHFLFSLLLDLLPQKTLSMITKDLNLKDPSSNPERSKCIELIEQFIKESTL